MTSSSGFLLRTHFQDVHGKHSTKIIIRRPRHYTQSGGRDYTQSCGQLPVCNGGVAAKNGDGGFVTGEPLGSSNSNNRLARFSPLDGLGVKGNRGGPHLFRFGRGCCSRCGLPSTSIGLFKVTHAIQTLFHWFVTEAQAELPGFFTLDAHDQHAASAWRNGVQRKLTDCARAEQHVLAYGTGNDVPPLLDESL